MVQQRHRKIKGTNRCLCGFDIIFILGDFQCVAQTQKSLGNSDYKLVKK